MLHWKCWLIPSNGPNQQIKPNPIRRHYPLITYLNFCKHRFSIFFCGQIGYLFWGPAACFVLKLFDLFSEKRIEVVFFGATIKAICHFVSYSIGSITDSFCFFVIFSRIACSNIGANLVNTLGPFIYYVSTFFLSTRNIFTDILGIFLLLYVLKISNYGMKILSKCNMEKEIVLILFKNLEVELSFVLT